MENQSSNVSRDRRTQDYINPAGAVVTSTPANYWRRISWGSIFAGVLVAIVVQLALSLLGIGIGLSTVDPIEESNPVAGLGIGAAIWYAVSSLIALFAGGWVAGRLASSPRSFDGMLHGILTWSLVTVVSFYFLTTTIGSIIGGVGSIVKNTLGAAGTVATGAIAGGATAGGANTQQGQGDNLDLTNLKNEVNQILAQTGKPGLQSNALGNKGENAIEQIVSNPMAADDVIKQFFGQNGPAGQIDREAVVNVVVARTGKSRQEANQIADNWIRTYEQAQTKWQQTKQQTEAKVRQAADATAKATSTASILAFVSLVVGAAVAGWGAKKGNDSRDDSVTVVDDNHTTGSR